MLLVLPVTKINQAEKSEVENRTLASWPEISRENLFQGQLAPELEKYFEDRFFGRDILLKISYAYNTFLKEHYENDEDIQSSIKMKRNKKTIKEIRK